MNACLDVPVLFLPQKLHTYRSLCIAAAAMDSTGAELAKEIKYWQAATAHTTL